MVKNVLDELSGGVIQVNRNVLYDLSDWVKRNAHVLNDVRYVVNWMIVMVTEICMYYL